MQKHSLWDLVLSEQRFTHCAPTAHVTMGNFIFLAYWHEQTLKLNENNLLMSQNNTPLFYQTLI